MIVEVLTQARQFPISCCTPFALVAPRQGTLIKADNFNVNRDDKIQLEMFNLFANFITSSLFFSLRC